jgi:hypothetical protein
LRNFYRRFNGGEIHTLKGNSSSPYFEEPHYSVVPAPRYWNTLKPSKVEQNQEDMMGNSISASDLVNYTNIDYVATQKMMSLSIGPSNNVSHATQTDDNEAANFSPMTSSFLAQPQQVNVFNVSLQPNGGPLGVTLSGSEDGQKPIIISGMAENGIAANTAQIQIGDTLLAINNENVVGMPLSKATKLLQVQNDTIELRLSRSVVSNNLMTNSILSINDKQQQQPPPPQALYAEVQRRPLNLLMKADALSNSTNSSRSGSNNSDGQTLKTIHVTLYKDQVYDDYGFSVSDGLYERGVYINRIRSGGPADQVGAIKPYDRIVQVI